MTEDKIKFLNNVIKPWEILNKQLSFPFSVNTSVSDFTNNAANLSVSIKHFPESSHNLKPKDLILESESYKIISDLADSLKHGMLSNESRQCSIFVGSMFERNPNGLVRFLRNTINIKHTTYGECDFMEISKESALFIASKIDFRSDWKPQIINNNGEFSNKIHVHASITNQVAWQGMTMQFVEFSSDGKYKKVDLNSTIEFTLTVDKNLAKPK
ncbi:MAG TPA: hypothetical protein VFZ33_18345 [Chitinophagaceae bacterium]